MATGRKFFYSPPRNDADAWKVKAEGAKCGKYTIYPCQHLTAWVRVEKYIFRSEEMIWFLGGGVGEMHVVTWKGGTKSYHTKEVAERIEELLNGEDLVDACNRLQSTFGGNESDFLQELLYCSYNRITRNEYYRQINEKIKGTMAILMQEDYWRTSPFSTAKYYGRITIRERGRGEHTFHVVNKEGITLLELSDPNSKHYVVEGKAIPPGEPADLIDEDFIPFYRKLGRDKFIEVLEQNQYASRDELLKLYKQYGKE